MSYLTSLERIGIEKGIQQRIQQGMQQGFQLGFHLGFQQGVAAVLERQLTRRFGPLSAQICARPANAPLEQLGQWVDNILDAKSLEDVFTNH